MKCRIYSLAVLILFLMTPVSYAQEYLNETFNHFTTGFPLTGAHRYEECANCHLNGQFKGTPIACASCHNGVRASGKSANHIITMEDCDNCHVTQTMLDVRFDHNTITGTCVACHNGFYSEAKPAAHLITNRDCGDCHRVSGWANTMFRHDGVAGLCSTCHNGIYVTGKNSGHVLTTFECDVCHRSTRSWNVLQ